MGSGPVSRCMLLAFRFKNHRSFLKGGELSLLSHRADKTHPESLIHPPKDAKVPSQVLPVIAIYGANSAGKTNVLGAFSYLKTAVVESQSGWRPNSGTKSDRFIGRIGAESPISVEADIICKGERYRYGFAANSRSFEEEWLYHYKKGKESLIFMRNTSLRDEKNITNVEFGDLFGGDTLYREGIERRVRDDSLLLSAAAQDNHPACIEIYNWFDNYVSSLNLETSSDRANAQITASFLAQHDDDYMKKNVITLLKPVEPNLIDIIISKNAKTKIPNSMREMLQPDAIASIESFLAYEIDFVFKRGRSKIRLPFNKQSKGFQKFFSMCVTIYFALQAGEVLLVDELETSIHPHLARLIVEMFQSKDINFGGGQLIFTTHDTGLLDQALLRRDQIWFVEKNQMISDLYSLLQFSPRKDENLERGYLRGRYGAIPALGIDLSLLSNSGLTAEASDASAD